MNRILTSQTPTHKGEAVTIAGWVHTRRDHGKITFLDIRDRGGLVQVVCTPQAKEAYETAQKARPEWVLGIEGMVQERPEGTRNNDIATGTIEIAAKAITVYSEAKTLPFAIDTDGYEIGEEKRLQYRYADLRRMRLQKNLSMRHRVLQFMRDFLTKEGFIEVETPILTKSTPEGARDFVVPSRLYPGTFYALPQSPQQYKQLLQVAGIERYFQIARCFRDEDPRADRQPEFTQLDIEMSFVDQGEIMHVIEELYTQIVKNFFPKKRILESPFPRISYKEAMEKWGSDKPDLRKNKQDPNELAFAFIVDFPMFEWKEQEKRWDAVHHPFTKIRNPKSEIRKENAKNLLALQYDLVLNGFEVGGGSIRETDPTILEQKGRHPGQIRPSLGGL
jgi:aspartyl-tRNA synthetase